MESNFTLDFPTLLMGVVVIAALYLIKAGILPWLSAKEDLARQEVARLDTHFASTESGVERLASGVLDSLQFDKSSPVVVATTPVYVELLKLTNKIMRETPERVPEEEVAAVFNQVVDFAKRLTDDIPGNALPPPQG